MTTRTYRPMSLWRLELLRLTRTRRWFAPVAIYSLFGLAGPATERYLGVLLSRFGGVEVVLPAPTPAGGFGQFVSNASQLGVLAVVVVAATSLSLDQPPEMGVFLRSRVRSIRSLMLPRVVTVAALATVSWVLGTLAAWYETSVLLGAVEPGAVAVGALYGAVYLAFVVAVVASVGSFGLSPMNVSLVSMGVVAMLPLFGLLRALESWVPSELVGALDGSIAGDSVMDPLPAAVTALVCTAALTIDAVRRTATRGD